jgi:HSP20 family protein
MNPLTQWNPFKPMSKFDAPGNFEDLFRSFALRPGWAGMDLMPEIRIDVSEDDKAFRVEADLPGVKKDDINVSVEGRQVEISAESRQKIEKKHESYLYTERSEGRVYRSFTLPSEIDSKRVEARYDGGVLSLTLPKKENGRGNRIAVS